MLINRQITIINSNGYGARRKLPAIFQGFCNGSERDDVVNIFAQFSEMLINLIKRDVCIRKRPFSKTVIHDNNGTIFSYSIYGVFALRKQQIRVY